MPDYKSDDEFVNLFASHHYEIEYSDNGNTHRFIEFCFKVVENIVSTWKNVPKESGPIGNISYGIINNFSFNAVTKKDEAMEGIGIHLGAFIKMRDVFLTLLSTPYLFPEQKGAKEENTTKDIARKYICQKHIDNFYPSNTPIPNSKYRLNKAFEYSYFCSLPLIYHEVGHLVRGHLDYINDNYSLNSLEEKKYKTKIDGNNKISHETLNALEFDADENAAEQSIFHVLTFNDPILSKLNTEEKIMHWAIGSYIYFLILDLNYEPNILGSDLQTHPTPFTRMGNYFVCAKRQIERYFPNLLTSYEQITKITIVHIRGVWDQLSVPVGSFGHHQQDSAKEAEKIKRYLQSLDEFGLSKYAKKRAVRVKLL